ncbi:hypothetical protein [Dyella silvatica]|uniref:hypothetical protein n=1 Tax=Dyella silvatica TaxID=2992128 RepID=UPI00224F303F|nr:hypothetical protein [Dyella silvatica]
MTDLSARRRMLQRSLAAIPFLLTLDESASASAQEMSKPLAGGADPMHDFDFFLGSWNVKHRRLKQWLVGSHDWEEFEGSSHCISLLGGIVNLNETVVHRSTGTYRGMGLRAYDAKTNSWADWYLDGRHPTEMDAPGIGRFINGVGTFLSDDSFNGKPVKLRGLFTPINANTCQWDQSYSADGGKTWETNWIMRYTRTA